MVAGDSRGKGKNIKWGLVGNKIGISIIVIKTSHFSKQVPILASNSKEQGTVGEPTPLLNLMPPNASCPKLLQLVSHMSLFHAVKQLIVYYCTGPYISSSHKMIQVSTRQEVGKMIIKVFSK